MRLGGCPEVLVHVQGGEFTAALGVFLERCQCLPVVGPTEAPWQQAMVERHGAVLGNVTRLAVEEADTSGT